MLTTEIERGKAMEEMGASPFPVADELLRGDSAISRRPIPPPSVPTSSARIEPRWNVERPDATEHVVKHGIVADLEADEKEYSNYSQRGEP